LSGRLAVSGGRGGAAKTLLSVFGNVGGHFLAKNSQPTTWPKTQHVVLANVLTGDSEFWWLQVQHAIRSQILSKL